MGDQSHHVISFHVISFHVMFLSCHFIHLVFLLRLFAYVVPSKGDDIAELFPPPCLICEGRVPNVLTRITVNPTSARLTQRAGVGSTPLLPFPTAPLRGRRDHTASI